MGKKVVKTQNFSDLIDKIKSIKDVKPKKEWVIFCRSNLEMRIKLERKKKFLNNDFSVFRQLFSSWKIIGNALALKIAYATFVILIVMGAGISLTAWASTKSMPGSPLYRVKIALEEMQLRMASQENKDKLQSDMANRRLTELRTVLDNTNTNQKNKKEQVKNVVGQIQQQLINDKNQIPLADLANKGEAGALTAVREAADRAKQVRKAIVEAKENLPAEITANLSEKFAEVTDTANKNSLEVLGVLINKPDRTESDNNEILAMFEEIIRDNELAIDNIAEKNYFMQAPSTADKFPINAVLVNQSDQARELIVKINLNLKEEDFSAALDTLKALNEIVRGAERIADGSDFSQETELIEPEEEIKDNSSTTDSNRP